MVTPATVLHDDKVLVDLPWPLTPLGVPYGSTIFLSGVPGRGKTTCALGFRPDLIHTSEQKKERVADRVLDVYGDDFDPSILVETNKPMEPLAHTERWMIDSINNFEDGEAFYRDYAVPWAQGLVGSSYTSRRLLIAIAQSTKDGGYRGSAVLPHLADVCLHLNEEETLGALAGHVNKNRFDGMPGRQGLGLFYYEIAKEGLRLPEFHGVFGVRPTEGYFVFEAKWTDRKRWYPAGLQVGDCKAVASVPKGMTPPWAVGMNKGATFAHTHNVCWHDQTTDTRIHCNECPTWDRG